MGTHLQSLKSNLQIKKIMQIFIQTDSSQVANVSQDMTLQQLKENYDLENTRLLCAGIQLDDDEKTLESYGIQEDTTIHAVYPLLGGGRKRKKKVYTTPKKIKHKRVKVKLATLKYYKVDDVGKLERKRKECPAEICGPGIFMSNHKDRQYCGKCALTIKFDEKK